MSLKNTAEMAILTDVTKCIGCEECVLACKKEHHLPEDRPWRWVRKIRDLSSSRWTTIRFNAGSQGRRYVRRQCLHCLEPACVEACIVGALKKTAEGPVVYDKDICIGCRYCMVACPWDIPKYSWEDTVPYVQKCDMCYDRVKERGLAPVCVEACPSGATIFGERKALLAKARQRLAAEPKKYIQKIFGAETIGGTSVLYISDVELELSEHKVPQGDTTPMPERTFKVLRHMPKVFLGMAAVMGGAYWVIERRLKIAEEEGAGLPLEPGGGATEQDEAKCTDE